MMLKSDNWFKRIICSSWSLALIPAIIISLLIQSFGTRYNLEITRKENIFDQSLRRDLDSDTITEIISVHRSDPYFAVSIRDNKQRYHDQWNLADSLNPLLSGVFFGNYDHDKYSEIYLFSHDEDSLFINFSEPLDPEGAGSDHLFIDRIAYARGKVLSTLYPAGFYDVNGDGFDECYFAISSSYTLGPRLVCYYDFISRTIHKSPQSGISLLFPEMMDADRDDRPEIFGLMSASGNYPSYVQYSDSSLWLMIFNEKLEFEFEPIEFPGFANGLSTGAFNGGYFLIYTIGGTEATALEPCVMLFSADGDLIKSRLLSDLGYTDRPVNQLIFRHEKSDRIILTGSLLTEIDDSLEIVNSAEPVLKSGFTSLKININNEGPEEIILYSAEEEKMAVYSEDLKLLAEQRIKTPPSAWLISHHFTENHEHSLLVQAGASEYSITMKPNNLYYLGYLKHPGIYLSFVLFIIFVRRINTWQIVRREDLKQRLLKLQLQGIKAQLDPHFTFNTLNSVSALIYLQDKETAYDYMNKFTRLLRAMVNDAERIYRHLDEEIEFVTTYLELEKLRFGEKFDYTIRVGENVSRSEEVPKLVLHTFAENAIKHGIMPRTNGGRIEISIDKEEGYLHISVEDNGVGRSVSEGNSISTGKGLKLTREFYEILNELNSKPIKHTITDLYSKSGEAAGTKADVWVPL